MIPFQSFLTPKLEEYIDYRLSLGYSDKTFRSQLRAFDRYVTKRKVDIHAFTPLFFLELRKDLKGEARTVNGILSAIRGFFQYLVRQEYCEENPLQYIPMYRENAFIPFVFSPDKIDQMLSSIQKGIRQSEEYFLNDFTVYIAILLLARCGMRISEPVRLKLDSYRNREETIYIEKTKFNKDRLIPVPGSVIREIDNYKAVRNACIDKDQTQHLLVGHKDKPLSKNKIYPVFQRAVKDIGIDQPRRIIANTNFGAPTPHSLRHSFAINTLKRIKEKGKSPQNALPILSAFMGHRKYKYTAVYLKVLDAEQRQGLVDFAISRQEDI